MKKILIRASIFMLICIQVVSIIFLLDQGKIAKAEVQGCVPVGHDFTGIPCAGSFDVPLSSGGGCWSMTFNCGGGVLASITRRDAWGCGTY